MGTFTGIYGALLGCCLREGYKGLPWVYLDGVDLGWALNPWVIVWVFIVPLGYSFLSPGVRAPPPTPVP